MEFTIDNLLEINQYKPDVIGTAERFGWWCLGFNFDVVATLINLKSASWQQGFEAGRNIASITSSRVDHRIIGV